jgi:hypothetical protein
MQAFNVLGHGTEINYAIFLVMMDIANKLVIIFRFCIFNVYYSWACKCT